jgi:predicted amidohydrolase YtcJ
MSFAFARFVFATLSLALTARAAEALVLTNARVYTANDQRPRAEAVVVENGRITFVGTSNAARAAAPRGARTIDLKGQTLLPGLVDSHAHLAGIGFREMDFNLEGASGIADLQARLKRRASEFPQQPWIVGRGWIESKWTPAAFPTRQDLDAVVNDRPVLLTRADGHGAIVNSRALELARVDRSTPDPAGGQILKDGNGAPTGMLIDRAIDLVRRLVPPRSEAETERALEIGAARSLQLGWTQLHTMSGSISEWRLLQRLIADGRIKLRVYFCASGPGGAAQTLLTEGATMREHDGRFTVRTVKVFIDGALGSRGAALFEPYSDAPDSRGLLIHTEDALLPFFITALRQGIQIVTHAIGDRGNRVTLDLYEKAFAAVPVSERRVAEPRWRIEHAQIIHAADIPRFAKLGVIASMQPSHAISDLYFAPKRLGAARLGGAYAWRSLIDAGAIIAGGSDAPVERGEPLIEFYAAVARRSLDGFANDDWHAEQRVSRAEALKMFTLWPARASFEENERGSIEVGKVADLTVLSADIMEIPAPDILKARCTMTVVGGEVVWEQR